MTATIGYRAATPSARGEPEPEWVLRSPDLVSGYRSRFHLKRRGPVFVTLCGLESYGWRRWPYFGSSRPALEASCHRCMRIATAHILEGRYERG